MRALDLYCGAGGVTRGLQTAGFTVTGVDIIPQKNYCGDEFVWMDVLDYLKTADLSRFDFIWASPPCQAYTSLRRAPGRHRDADLVGPTRKALGRVGLPYCIENVVGAPLIDPVQLCGSMFGLETDRYPRGYRIERHRLFETSFPLLAPVCQHDKRPVLGVYGGHFRDRRRPTGVNHKPNSNVPTELGYRAMEIPFGSMTTAEISDAIPPAYSKFVAEAWLRSVRNARLEKNDE
jgi:DNA (cytosine-5)-methyltransferase 1